MRIFVLTTKKGKRRHCARQYEHVFIFGRLGIYRFRRIFSQRKCVNFQAHFSLVTFPIWIMTERGRVCISAIIILMGAPSRRISSIFHTDCSLNHDFNIFRSVFEKNRTFTRVIKMVIGLSHIKMTGLLFRIDFLNLYHLCKCIAFFKYEILRNRLIFQSTSIIRVTLLWWMMEKYFFTERFWLNVTLTTKRIRFEDAAQSYNHNRNIR